MVSDAGKYNEFVIGHDTFGDPICLYDMRLMTSEHLLTCPIVTVIYDSRENYAFEITVTIKYNFCSNCIFFCIDLLYVILHTRT